MVPTQQGDGVRLNRSIELMTPTRVSGRSLSIFRRLIALNILALILGGLLGTLLRYGLSLWIPAAGAFPLPILIINWAGCLFLGWLFTVATIRKLPPSVRIGAGTGFTGAFTTFSTFTVQTVDAIHTGQVAVALAYFLASLIGGLLMAWAGVSLGQKMRSPKAGEPV